MSISITRAFKDIFQQKSWLKKTIIVSIISIFSGHYTNILNVIKEIEKLPQEIAMICYVLLIVFSIISILATFWMCGYISTTLNKSIEEKKFTFADLNTKNLLATGFKTYIGTNILAVLIFTLIALFCFIMVIAVAAAALFADRVIATSYIDYVVAIIGFIFVGFITLVLSVFISRYINAAWVYFCRSLKFGDFFKFEKIIEIVHSNKKASWVLLGKEILLCILALLAIVLLFLVSAFFHGISPNLSGMLYLFALVALFPVCITTYFAQTSLFSQYAQEIEIDKF